MELKRIGCLALALLMTSCVTISEPYETREQSGTWVAKAQAKDLTTNKTYNISLDITATAPSLLRIDMTGTLGVNLASLVLNEGTVKYVLYRKKKYYEGTASDQALLPLFNLNLNPQMFMNICMDSPISEPGWTCQVEVNGMADSCVRGGDGFTITWSERQGDRKRVTIKDKSFELQIVFKSYTALDETKVQKGAGTFHLEAPKDFAKYKIP